MEARKMPEASFRAGALSAAVWANDNGKGTYYTVALKKEYKTDKDEWKTTSSLRVNDLPKAAVLLQKAYEHIVLNGKDA